MATESEVTIFAPGDLPPEGEYRILAEAERSWIVAVVEGRPYAFRNRCGHIPQRMDGGRLQGRIWRCPHHGIRYDIGTGEVVDDRGFNFIQPLEIVACELLDGSLVLQTGE